MGGGGWESRGAIAMTDSWLAIGRGVLLCGVLLLGGSATATWLAPSRAITRSVRMAALLLLAGLALQLLGQLRAFDAFAPEAEPLADTLALIGSTDWASRRVALLALAVAVLGASALPRVWADRALRLLAVTVLGLLPLMGHAAAVETGRGRAYGLALVHAVAATLWLGTLLVLARPWWLGVAAVQRAIGHYGRVALVAAPAVVLTGVVTAWPRVGGFAGLFGTPYGLLLLAKVACVGAVLALGAGHHRRLVRGQGEPTRGSLLAELLGALAVLALTGWLAESAPGA
jgi:putative copper resistance protein D